MSDVIVIGAGVIGAACAWRLARTGHSVTWLEREAPAAGASRAALGILQFHASPGEPLGCAHLARRGAELYPAWMDELLAETGECVPYRTDGQLMIALAEKDWAKLEAEYAWSAALDVPVERLTAAACLKLEPALNPRVLGGLYFPEDAWVDSGALTLALARAARRAGARLESVTATAVERAGDRVTGVRAGERLFRAEWVVLAAGCWSGQIMGVPPLAVRPVRGQAMAVGGQPARRVISSVRGHVVPQASGHTLVGATVEEVGYDEGVTFGGLAEVSALGIAMVPRLAGLAWAGAWAGLRPATPDGKPYVGPFAECPNVVAATGHFRDGFLQAPATAEIVTAIVQGAMTDAAVKELRPDRRA